MVYRAIELDGTCSGEHGVGLGKVEYLERELGGGTVGLMESIKRTGESYRLGGRSVSGRKAPSGQSRTAVTRPIGRLKGGEGGRKEGPRPSRRPS